MIEFHKNRSVITLSGPDRKKLLQGIITNNVDQLKSGGVGVYSALLTPQGKFLHDFFMVEHDEVIYLDCEAERMPDLFRRLLMYRLRSNVEIVDQSEKFQVATSEKPIDELLSFEDPRNSQMGYRAIIDRSDASENVSLYHERRIKLGIPEGTHDFIPEKSTIHEGHFEAINGVDFEKGCYVGQEVIARMKYRGKIKKAMYPVTLTGDTQGFGSEITGENGNKIGDLRSTCDKYAIASFRTEMMEFGSEYDCCGTKVTPFRAVYLGNDEND